MTVVRVTTGRRNGRVSRVCGGETIRVDRSIARAIDVAWSNICLTGHGEHATASIESVVEGLSVAELRLDWV